MASTITLGMASIEMGELENGGVATSFAPIGNTYQDSLSVETADPTITEHYVEESDDPIATIAKAGKTTIKFQIPDPDLANLSDILGGTYTSSEGWAAPSTLPIIEKSVKVVTKQGFDTIYTRVSISGKWTPPTTSGGIGLLEVQGSVLTPTKANEPKVRIIQHAEE